MRNRQTPVSYASRYAVMDSPSLRARKCGARRRQRARAESALDLCGNGIGFGFREHGPAEKNPVVIERRGQQFDRVKRGAEFRDRPSGRRRDGGIESPAVMTPGFAFAVETTFVESPDPPWTPPEVKTRWAL